MGIGQFVRRITPPILLDLFNRSSANRTGGNLWEGIYPHYKEVPCAGEQFDGNTWIDQTRAYTERMLLQAKQCRSIPTEVIGEHMLLPLLAAVVSENSGGRVSILDFGGGMGVTYVHLISSLVNCGLITYHVVERQRISKGGAELFENDARIRFLTELPTGESDFDIVYMSSALQYIEDYPALLKALTSYHAKYFLFVKLSTGDFPTYATAQKNVSGTTLPYWFVNIGEIIEMMAAGGYSLIYKSALEQQYDQSNFPPEYRLGRACNLLFSRN